MVAFRPPHPRIFVFLLTFTLGLIASIASHSFRQSLEPNHQSGLPVSASPRIPEATPDPERPSDYVIDEDKLAKNDYVFNREFRKAGEFIDESGRPDYQESDVAYVSAFRSGKLVRKFDANIFRLGGNSANLAVFPFLGQSSEEVFISQDTFRGGCQWVVAFSRELHVIFDGQKFGVGREGADMRAVDLDGDQLKEIVVPLTDFYELQDKMSISQIPLPEIIFKYDSNRQEYLPANPRFKEYFDKYQQNFQDASTNDELQYRSDVLHAMTVLIYSGRRDQAWHRFQQFYKLRDKPEMEQRIKSVLAGDRVYNFIYKRPNH